MRQSVDIVSQCVRVDENIDRNECLDNLEHTGAFDSGSNIHQLIDQRLNQPLALLLHPPVRCW